MSTQTWKGPVVPDEGDDLLAAWHTFTDTAGIITTAASVAAARVTLSTAEAAGQAPTANAPAFFIIGGILYVSDGSRNAGVWILRPINEGERYRAGRTEDSGVTRTLASGATLNVISTTLPARPYNRAITCQAVCYGSVTGAIYLQMTPPGDQKVSSRFAAGDTQSQVLPARGIIAAGTAPAINLLVEGGSGGGSITFGASGDNTVLFIDAFPVTMA